MKFSKSKAPRKGFTLAELLVAMTITVVLVSLVVVITGSALDAWRGARNEIRASRQAKAMLDFLGKDLESLVIRSGNNFEWLNVTNETREIGPENEPSPNASTLVFLTSATDRYDGNVGNSSIDKGGDISAVGYQLEYLDPIFGDVDERYSRFVLYRNLIDPDQAFQTLLANDDLAEAYQTSSAGATEARNFICENVYEISVVFSVEYKDTSGDTQVVKVPVMGVGGGANAVDEFSITGEGIKTGGTEPLYAKGRITSVDLAITVLSDTGMRQLRQRRFGTSAARSKFISENAYHYTKTVIIPQP